MPFLAPLVGAFSAFASTWIGSLIVSVGASMLGGLLQQWLTPKPEQQRQPGFSLQVEMGDTKPLAFQVGYAATAGSRKYMGTWGNNGDVPNAYLTEVIQLADLPIGALNGFWANKQRSTILWSDPPTEQGYPVQEFRKNGIDHMWVKFRTGYETTADPFLVSKFGALTEYAWTNAFIGRGAPHVIVTSLLDQDRELFKSQPTFLMEPQPRAFYDIRKDSTNGGSGAHRWNDQSTWEPTVNPVIIIYNIIRGIYYNGEWIYGGRNLPAFRLPASSWIAAANECDVPIALAGGGTEPQFRCGMEISVEIEPLVAIEELKRSCNARTSEIGGIWEIVVGAPGAAVYAFTDDDIVVTRKQGYRSFPSLNEIHNGIEATYPEPGEYWDEKDAPARYNAAWEVEDGGRRLATGLTFLAVPYGTQTQRLMQSLINDDRRWRTHVLALPPDAWSLTGTSVVSWTSERNGYVDKKFLITRIEGEPGMIQPVILREIDPSDYAWSSDMQLPNPIGNLVIVRPSPQLVTGFQVFPAIIYDSDGIPRRPSIQVVYDGNMPDIRAVYVLVRLKSSGAYVFDGEIPFAVPYSNILNGVFLNATTYEVAVKYVPFSGRPTEFTAYLEVTTADIKLVAGKDFDPFEGVVDFDTIGPGIREWTKWIGTSFREFYEQLQANAVATGHAELSNQMTFSEIRREMATSIGDLSATFEEVIVTAIVPIQGELQAFADALTQITAANSGDISSARLRMTVLTGPTGYARMGAETRFDASNIADWRGAAWYLDTPNNPALPTRFVVKAEQFIVEAGAGDLTQLLIVDGGGLRVNVGRFGTIFSALIQSGSGTSFWNLDTGAFRIST